LRPKADTFSVRQRYHWGLRSPTSPRIRLLNSCTLEFTSWSQGASPVGREWSVWKERGGFSHSSEQVPQRSILVRVSFFPKAFRRRLVRGSFGGRFVLCPFSRGLWVPPFGCGGGLDVLSFSRGNQGSCISSRLFFVPFFVPRQDVGGTEPGRWGEVFFVGGGDAFLVVSGRFPIFFFTVRECLIRGGAEKKLTSLLREHGICFDTTFRWWGSVQLKAFGPTVQAPFAGYSVTSRSVDSFSWHFFCGRSTLGCGWFPPPPLFWWFSALLEGPELSFRACVRGTP